MAKSRKSKKKRNKSSVSLGSILAILGAFCILAVLVGSGAYLYVKTEKEFVLKEDLCPEEGARGTVAILLDTTDELAQVTKTEVRSRILSLQNSLGRFYRLSVYTFSSDGLNARPLASLCNPGRLDQMDELAQKGLTANPAMIKRKYEEFEKSIAQSVGTVFGRSFEAEETPLLASVQELHGILPAPMAIDTELYPAGVNQIVLVSDLLEHTDVFSIYRTGIDIEAYDASRAKEKFGRSYKSTDLKFWVVGREIGEISTLDLMNFWSNVFTKDFKNAPTFQKLPGEI